MLTQFKMYFITVTIIIFMLMVTPLFNSRKRRVESTSTTNSPFNKALQSGKKEKHHSIDILKADTNTSLFRSFGIQKVRRAFDDVKNKSDISFLFPQYKSYLGKNFTFRTDNKSLFLKEEQYAFYQKAILNGAINITKIAISELSNSTIDDIREMIGQPVNDVRDLGDEKESEFILLNSSNKEFYVGDTVAVRVDVFNSRKIPQLLGGDEVRVWIKDQSKGASMAVEVEDLKNGSYVAKLPLLLPGNVSIFASLAYPKEILKSIFFLRVIMRAIRLNAGGFVSRTASETTLCSPFPIDYHGNGLCNLTGTNWGLSWFCGKPRNPTLSCEHWSETKDMHFPYPLPVGRAEQDWFDLISMGKKHHLRALRDSVIEIKVLKRKDPRPTRPAKPYCGNRPHRETWEDAAPRGMFYKMSWMPFGCRAKRHHFKAMRQSLKGYRIHLIGDSNLLSWVDIFQKNNLCNLIKNPIDNITGTIKVWHDPVDCVNHKYNLRVRWRTHGLPFHTNPDHWASLANRQSVATTLDNLPANDKTVVLIHLFMHFSTQHYSVFLDRVKSMRDAIKRLLDRNASIKVFIRGPHVAYREWPASMGGDAQGPIFLQILRDEFYDLYDKVYLLDFWDMTVAGENKEFHPTMFITLQMINLFFGYVIDT